MANFPILRQIVSLRRIPVSATWRDSFYQILFVAESSRLSRYSQIENKANWPEGDLEKRFRRVELKGNYDYNCQKRDNRKKEDSQVVQVVKLTFYWSTLNHN